MLYGQIAENPRINEFIYRCFKDLPESEQRKFVKKFGEQPHDQNQVMHTLAELTCGAYLSSQGYRVSCDYNLNGQTPDWCILNDAGLPQAIIDVRNFHIDQITEQDIEQQKQNKLVVVVWRDGNTNNKDRLYENIKQKAEKYRDLANTLALPYVIAVRPDFRAAVDIQEVSDCLFSKTDGIFELYLHVSGVLYFEEDGGRYIFRFISNPKCLRMLDLPEGYFM
jgi:hypothetical protein